MRRILPVAPTPNRARSPFTLRSSRERQGSKRVAASKPYAERERLNTLADEWGGDASKLVLAWIEEGRLPRRSADRPGA